MLVIDIRLVAYIIAETIELDRQESNYYKVQFVSNNPILGVKKNQKAEKRPRLKSNDQTANRLTPTCNRPTDQATDLVDLRVAYMYG